MTIWVDIRNLLHLYLGIHWWNETAIVWVPSLEAHPDGHSRLYLSQQHCKLCPERRVRKGFMTEPEYTIWRGRREED
jgi:hypothetical protein